MEKEEKRIEYHKFEISSAQFFVA
ncbi:hypothetical protein LCGC14_1973350, partial [marine sediment metagenome]